MIELLAIALFLLSIVVIGAVVVSLLPDKETEREREAREEAFKREMEAYLKRHAKKVDIAL